GGPVDSHLARMDSGGAPVPVPHRRHHGHRRDFKREHGESLPARKAGVRHGMRGFLPALALALVMAHVVAPPVWAQSAAEVERELAEQRKELNAVRERLKREQRELANLKNKRSATQGELNKLRRNI